MFLFRAFSACTSSLKRSKALVGSCTLALLTLVPVSHARAQMQSYHGGATTRALISGPIDSAKLVTLKGNTHFAAVEENDRGFVGESFNLDHMQLVMQRPPEVEQEITATLDELQRKGSATYHKWLTPEQFATRFGPAPADLERVSVWLQQQGFRVENIAPNGMIIEFSGNAGMIKRAFHTEIHKIEVDGEDHFANMTDPQIPEALAGAVRGIHALHNFMPHPMLKARPKDTIAYNSTSTYYAVTPPDLATIYNFNPAFQSGLTGAGQTVYVIEDTVIKNPSDIATFRSAFGLSGYSGTFTQVAPSAGMITCNPSGVNGAEGEAALDAEWAGAAAPNASIVLASCADTSTVFGGLIALENLIYTPSVPVVSISYGECEASNGAAANASYVTTYEEASMQGTSIYVSAGDEGAASCDANKTVSTHGIAVSGFASTPYNVAVGGTDFGDQYTADLGGAPVTNYWSGTNTATYGSALSYIPEIPWNDSCSSFLIYNDPVITSGSFTQAYSTAGFCNSTIGKGYRTTSAGSGGPSAYSKQPSWQTGIPGLPTTYVAQGNNPRYLPDVSLFAANGVFNHFFLYCLSDVAEGGTPCDYSAGNSTNVLNDLAAGGTSFSSPILAGVQALINQSTGMNAGNPNPNFYKMGALEYGTSGNSSCNSSLGTGEAANCVFNDVTLGDIDVNCRGTYLQNPSCYGSTGTSGSSAQGSLSTSGTTYNPAYGTNTGWDYATGLGTVNVFNLISNWNLAQTKLTLVPSSTSGSVGQSVTLTLTITSYAASEASANGETVTFLNGTTSIGTGTLTNGLATLTTTTLPAGTLSLTATYPGDVTFATGNSNAVFFIVKPAVTVSSDTSAISANQSVMLTANVIATPAATGMVTFTDTTTGVNIGTCNLITTASPSTCSASVTGSQLNFYNNAITATYDGNGNYSAATSTPINVAVAGGPSFSVYPNMLSFPVTVVGARSQSQIVTVTNMGSTPVYTGASFSGPNASAFLLTSKNCGNVNPGQSCSFSVAFAPTAAVSDTATFNVGEAYTSGGPTTPVSLSGTGTIPATVTLTAGPLTFPSTVVGGRSASQTVTLTNNGATSVFTAVSFSGSNPSSYLLTAKTCSTLAGGQSCTFSVAFAPTTSGPLAANFNVTAQGATNSPQSVSLSGTGLTPSTVTVGPGNINFPATAVKSRSASQMITLTNNGTSPVTTIVEFTGANQSSFLLSSKTCSTLAGGASCTFSVAFQPTSGGPLSANFVIYAKGATNSPQTVALSGTGGTTP